LKTGNNFNLGTKFQIPPFFGIYMWLQKEFFFKIGKNLYANVDLARDPLISAFYPISTPG
jgi:hypothetical protein